MIWKISCFTLNMGEEYDLKFLNEQIHKIVKTRL